MRRLVSVLLPLLLAVACSREVPLLPAFVPARPLSLSPATRTVSPYEAVTFVAQGGTGSCSFSLSDPAAGTLEPLDDRTARLVAAAQPGLRAVVLARAGEATAEAAITIGAALALQPERARVAPGEELSFVASGGLPAAGNAPYTFALVEAFGGSISAEGRYTATPTANVTEVVEVRDATGVAVARAPIAVGAAVALSADLTGVLPPRSVVQLSATGGGGEYRFTYAPVSGDGESIDARTGRFQLGGSGSRRYVAEVVDRWQQRATLNIDVGPAVALTQAAGALRPGQPSRVIASGGKPPYKFFFAERGNRSFGQVDKWTGEYTPGPNAGTRDVLRVVDSLEAAAEVTATSVGPARLDSGASSRCLGADLDADGAQEAVWAQTYDSCCSWLAQGRITTGGPGRSTASYRLAQPLRAVESADVDGDRRDDLLALTDTGLLLLRGQHDGKLGAPQPLLARSAGVAGANALAVARSGTDVDLYVAVGASALCATGGWAQVHFDGAGSLSTSCAQTFVPADRPQALVADDLDGDGAVDLAWIDAAGTRLEVRYGPDFAAAGSVAMGARQAFTTPTGQQTIPHALLTWRPPGTSRSIVIIGLQDSSLANNHLMTVALAGRTPLTQTLEWDPPDSAGLIGLTLARATGDAGVLVLGWNGNDSQLREALLRPDATLEKHEAWSPTGDLVQCAASVDVDGDGAQDLVSNDATQEVSQLLYGAGVDGFNARVAFAGLRPAAPLVTADMDGDGRDDVLTRGDGLALRHLAGIDGWLALGAESRGTAGPMADILAVDLDNDGRRDAVFDASGEGLVWRPGLPGGLLDAAQALEPVDWRSVTNPPLEPVIGHATDLLAASLSGDAPGPDLVALRQFPDVSDASEWTTRVWVRSASGATYSERAPLGVSAGRCRAAVADATGDLIDDALLLCSGGGSVGATSFGAAQAFVALSSSFVNKSQPMTNSARLNYGAWSAIYTFTAASGAGVELWPLRLPAHLAPFVESAANPLSPTAAERRAHTTWALFSDPESATPRAELVQVSHDGTALRVQVTSIAVRPVAATLADLDGDALVDVAIQTADQRLVTLRGTGVLSAPGVFLSGQLVGSARLTSGDGPDDLVTRINDRLVVYRNDGSGGF